QASALKPSILRSFAMRLCRFAHSDRNQVGLYDDKFVVSLAAAAEAYANATHEKLDRLGSDDLLDFLPPDGKYFAAARKVADWTEYVAGYTVMNDISDRKFRPNPGRKERTNDKWFDWEHGKWHDTFAPCGPCITSADAIPDPQNLKMKLTVSGSVKQDATTAQQIFPVAAVVAFISDIVTLEPGDLISTGTPGGVGATTGTVLKPGDRIEAWIGGIGTLVSLVVAGS